MNKVINIDIKNKIAQSPTDKIICGNSDYVLNFTFDEEWDAYIVKTVRFIIYSAKKEFIDIVFEGNTVAVPIIRNTNVISVGVYAGNLSTTTPALISCEKSILCENGVPLDPTPDVYNQIIDMLNQSGGTGGGVVYKAGSNIEIKNNIISVTTTDEIEEDNTKPVTSAAVNATLGNIDVLLKLI